LFRVHAAAPYPKLTNHYNTSFVRCYLSGVLPAHRRGADS
jgi:hypothetical protein